MPYQRVSVPRFYISYGDWWEAIGNHNRSSIARAPRWNTISPHKTTQITVGTAPEWKESVAVPPSSAVMAGVNWFACLNHNIVDGYYLLCKQYNTSTQEETAIMSGESWDTLINLVAIDSAVTEWPNPVTMPYQGFSLGTFTTPWTDIGADSVRVGLDGYAAQDDTTFDIGCWLFGSYYDMKNAPNLSLTISREYGGTKETTTYNGSSISNTMWNAPPKWGNLGAWELRGGYVSSDPSSPHTGSFPSELSRSGRRSWQLKFSYMDQSDLFGPNQMTGNIGGYLTTDLGYDSADIENSASFNYNLLTDDNFFSSVWNKTLGPTCSFLFQVDSSNSNPDQFAICRFKNNSLKATRTAHNVYDISLTIEEVW